MCARQCSHSIWLFSLFLFCSSYTYSYSHLHSLKNNQRREVRLTEFHPAKCPLMDMVNIIFEPNTVSFFFSFIIIINIISFLQSSHQNGRTMWCLYHKSIWKWVESPGNILEQTKNIQQQQSNITHINKSLIIVIQRLFLFTFHTFLYLVSRFLHSYFIFRSVSLVHARSVHNKNRTIQVLSVLI